jgi:hypothetical protein
LIIYVLNLNQNYQNSERKTERPTNIQIPRERIYRFRLPATVSRTLEKPPPFGSASVNSPKSFAAAGERAWNFTFPDSNVVGC